MNIQDTISGIFNKFIDRVLSSKVRLKAAANTASQLIAAATFGAGFKFKNTYKFECWRNGQLAWSETVHNQVMTAGINDLLTQYFKGSAYTAAFFVGLVDNASFSAYSAADTMASHAGWLESAAYSNATRPALTLGTASAGSIDNSASKAVFNINATATILGGFVTTNSTKSGTTGTLYGAASFTGGARSVLNGDTLNCTISLSAS
jgi:hypothetical protein